MIDDREQGRRTRRRVVQPAGRGRCRHRSSRRRRRRPPPHGARTRAPELPRQRAGREWPVRRNESVSFRSASAWLNGESGAISMHDPPGCAVCARRSKLTAPPIIASLSPHANATVAMDGKSRSVTATAVEFYRIVVRPQTCRTEYTPAQRCGQRPVRIAHRMPYFPHAFRTMPEPELHALPDASVYRIADLQLDTARRG